MARSLLSYRREPWMDTIDPAAMTEAQATRFAAYQEQQKALKEKEEVLRTKVEGDLKRLRDEFDSTSAQLRDDLRTLQAVRRVYERERLMVELASYRLIQKIELEEEAEATEALSRAKQERCRKLLQQLHQELQKQQGVCWLLEDEKATAQQSQKEKAAALSAAHGSTHMSVEGLATLTKKIHEAESVNKAFEELKDAVNTGPEGPLRMMLEASRDSIYAHQKLVLASEAADAEQHKLANLRKSLQRQMATVKWRTQVTELEAQDVMERTKDVHLLRINRGMQKILQMRGTPVPVVATNLNVSNFLAGTGAPVAKL
ncbi:hypothetical protein Emag_005730 [Eimeria magna]